MKRKPYLKTFPATIVSLINTAFALLAFVILFRTVFYLGTYIGTTIRAFQFNNFSMIQKLLSGTLSSTGSLIPQMKLTDVLSLPFTFHLTETILASIFVVILSVITPVLIIFNGIGSFNLRFWNKGYRMLKVVHIFYAILTVLSMISIVYTYIRIFIDNNLRTVITVMDSKNIWIILSVFIGIGIFVLILQIVTFCYHKDIVQQMTYIRSDLQDQEDVLDENHLSGIACFFGIIFLIPAVVLTIILKDQYSIVSATAIILLFIYSIKYFCVAASNRGLKSAVRAKSRRNRRNS